MSLSGQSFALVLTTKQKQALTKYRTTEHDQSGKI